MKKIIFAFIMVFALVGCDSSSAPSAPSVDEPEVSSSSVEMPEVNIPVDSFRADFPGKHITHGLYFSEVRSDVGVGIFKIMIANENYNVENYKISYVVTSENVEPFANTVEVSAKFNGGFYIQFSNTRYNWTVTITKIEAMITIYGDYQTIWTGSFQVRQGD